MGNQLLWEFTYQLICKQSRLNSTTVGYISLPYTPQRYYFTNLVMFHNLFCRGCEPSCWTTGDTNAIVLHNFVLMIQTYPFDMQVESMTVFEMSPIQPQFHSVSPQLAHVFYMITYCLERSLWCQAFSYICKLSVRSRQAYLGNLVRIYDDTSCRNCT